jgi:hypothetical protein
MSLDSDNSPSPAGGSGVRAGAMPLRWVISGLIGLAVLFSLARGLTRTLQPQDAVTGKQRAEATIEGKHLQVTAWINQDRAHVGRTVRVWFQLENGTKEPVSARVLLFEAPGFGKPSTVERSFKGFPFYLPGAADKPVPLSKAGLEVPAGGSTYFWVEMAPAWWSGSSMVTSVFQWRSASGETSLQPLDVGPVRLTNPVLGVASNGVETFMSLVETFAIPLGLALVGWLLQGKLQELSRQQQAWASMLPESHKNNSEMYLPLIKDIMMFSNRLKKYEDGAGEEQCREAFFFLLLAMRRMREVGARGGFYLKDRKGEKVVALCWNTFVPRLTRNLDPYEDLSSVVDSIKLDESYSRHRGKVERLPNLEAKRVVLQQKFHGWIDDVHPRDKRDFCLVRLFRLLLDFEINQIYEFWYGAPQDFPFEECEKELKSLKNGSPDPEFESIVSAIESYSQAFRKAAAAGSARGARP